MKTYIALDLETTGFDPEIDQVIEIAAIKFEGDTITDQFESMVKPGLEIPPMVTHITGITNQQLENAPVFETIKDQFLKFIGNFPIIGHNIDFDLTFLKAKGLPLKNKQYDTFELAGILIPGLPSYSLDTISRLLKIRHEQKHRALSDAHVCFELFNLLQAKISEIPANTLDEIRTLTTKSNWDLGEIFLDIESKPPKSIPAETAHQKKSSSKIPDITTIDQVLDLYDQNSLLSKLIPNYEERSCQRKLTDKILFAFQNNSHLIAEAGTGTGKTFAYLLAACFWNQQYRQKIVISTFTNNLQDQLIHKDFPLLQQIFPKVKLTVLKGRKNYLSLQRFHHLKNKSAFADFEIIVIIKILLWINHTQTGDLDEINFQNKELTLLEEICCSIDAENLPNDDEKYLMQARKKAEEADIIVVNHALLLQDAIGKNEILPQTELLIIDEAHHLNKVATDSLSVNLTPNYFRKNIEKLEKTLDEIQDQENPNLFNSDSVNQLEKILYTLKLNLQQLLKESENLFLAIGEMLEEFGRNQNEFQTILAVNFLNVGTTQWQKISGVLKQLIQLSSETAPLLNRVLSICTDHDPETLLELTINKQNLDKLFDDCREIFNDFDQKITWLAKTVDENLHLQSVPINVSKNIKSSLFDYKKSIILTSATLTTNNSFEYIRKELGLGEEFDQIQLPSNFSYPDQVKIIIPENLSDPRNENYIHECSEIIKNVILKNGGRTLVLFTAKKELSRVFHTLAPELKRNGINLLAQSISGGRGKIISQFKDEPDKSAIFGTNSFWEGVDILGQDLNCVIIQKLPFDPPDDPIINARSAGFSRPFEQYALPRAILRFKQGFGRLIRSSQDTGSVVILDSRLVQKSYGHEFLESLPSGIKINICQKDNTQACL
jgi:predicted DnaQ family exonuclease/DinG family helicase